MSTQDHRFGRKPKQQRHGRRRAQPLLESLEDRCVPAALVYVDDDWAGTTVGADPDGGGGATAFGTDAFATIQAAVDAVDDGGIVVVAAGDYTETVSINKSLTLNGAQAGVDPNDADWNDTRTVSANESILHGAVNLSLRNTIIVDGFTIERTAANEGYILIGAALPQGSGTASAFTIQNTRIIGTRDTGTTWSGIHTNFLNDPTAPGAQFVAHQNRILISGTASGSGILVNQNNAGSDGLGSATITATYVEGSPGAGFNVNTPGASALVDGNRVVNDDIFTYHADNTVISNNVISDSPERAAIATTNGSDNWTATNNTIINPHAAAILVANIYTAGDANSNVTVSGNTVTVDASLFTSTNFNALFDFQGALSGTNLMEDNTLTVTGTVGVAALHGVRVGGNVTSLVGGGVVENLTIRNNDLQGGDAGGAGDATQPASSGIFIDTNWVAADLDLTVENNFVNGWANAVAVFDTDPGAYGNLPSGAAVRIFNNDLSGNTLGVQSGSGEVVDASGNYWGVTSGAEVGALMAGNVDYTPWLDSGTDTSTDPGFQGSFDVLHVDDSSAQSGTAGRIEEAIALTTGGTPTVILEAGTYAENVVANKSGLVLRGATGTPTDVVIDPTAGNGITVTQDGVTISDLRVTGAVAGISATGIAELTLTDIRLDGNVIGGLLDNVASVDFTASDGADVITLTAGQLTATGVQTIAFNTLPDLALNGGQGDDIIHVAAGAVANLAIDGQSGNDTVTVQGSAAAETAVLAPTWGYLNGPGYAAIWSGTETAYVYGGGNDTALLYDSAGDDVFQARPEYAYLTGPGYFNWAVGFGTTAAYASLPGVDTAYLFDSAGDDVFQSRPEYAYLTGSGYFNWAVGFDTVAAYAGSGNDTAYLFDSAGNDVYQSRPEYAYLTGAGFFNWAVGFDTAYGYSTGGADAAFLFGSAGNDAYGALPEYAFLQGAGFINWAFGFASVTAFGGGGSDAAYLYDSAASDTFFGAGSDALLALGGGRLLRGVGFSGVSLYSLRGGVDTLNVGAIDYLLQPFGPWA